MKFKTRHILLLLVMLLSGASCFAASVRLTVQSGRGRGEIGVGDLFYISYEVTNLDATPEKPATVREQK